MLWLPFNTLYHSLCSSVGKIPLLYGFSKIHKPEITIHPIVSFLHSPTYQLSKHLVSLLSHSLATPPPDFASNIRSQTPSCDEILVSSDVFSLFPNIPVSLATSIAHTYILQDETLQELNFFSLPNCRLKKSPLSSSFP